MFQRRRTKIKREQVKVKGSKKISYKTKVRERRDILKQCEATILRRISRLSEKRNFLQEILPPKVDKRSIFN